MDKNTRICIVGGGPAGLSAGMYLEQKGYENYTILERLDRVGGKCWSPHYNGRRYEMGAIMGVPSYYAVHDVEEFCGITHDGPKLNRNYKDGAGNVIDPFARKLGNIIRNPWLLKMKSQMTRFGELLAGPWAPDALLLRLDALVESIRPEMPQHCAKWASVLPLKRWESRVDTLRGRVEERAGKIIGYITACLNLSTADRDRYFGAALERIGQS